MSEGLSMALAYRLKVYGQLRVENQLGFTMVNWIQAIEFVADLRSIHEGEGDYAEDHKYFGELTDI